MIGEEDGQQVHRRVQERGRGLRPQLRGEVDQGVRGELGLNDKTLSHWVSRFKKEGRTGSGMTDEDKEIARLKRENERLRMENEFLKKASAFFARNQA